jgi:thiosulfate reductase cytochrome b subunit
MPAPSTLQNPAIPRHSAIVRATHWLTVLAFFALLLSGLEIVVSHPRFYWGETGNSGTTPLFIIPIPASRGTVPTGYGYEMPDQNGWSRYLHFQSAWVLVLTGLVYVAYGLWTRHFRDHLVPRASDRKWQAIRSVFSRYLRRAPADPSESHAYNVVQRLSYLAVIFVLFPLVIWTGLALSPSFVSAFPASVELLGGRQSARTLHFFVTWLLVLFVVVHVAMIALAGFWTRTRGMITGGATGQSKGRVAGPTAVAQEHP